ncbi:hypothetical protein GJ688_05435 [Heliobacillus mobilis]|uniref:Uncharacterized protein n=2 Tax=Heliobacterium TaxID=2697 RepID=A0A6I3SI03_HELMO|nr:MULTISPECIES: hypothetical protein [Heliobacterium]MBC9784148.1 hypothetical protein [Heliobacterium chlorum]MTV48425.1 hypothetical protein [Heliobacterium mobile]
MIVLSLCTSGCCPTVEIVEGMVVIQDDHGGKVSLTREQVKILVDRFPQIEGMF